jgi:signal transduction histidine kinase
MSIFAGGLCLLFGSYAHQVQKAERAHRHNQLLLDDLHVANQQLQDYATQVEGLAAEQERGRLARELHDSVTQTVFSMNLTVQSARLLLAKDPERAAAQLLRLEELATSAMAEIQTLVSQLRPASVADEGLPAALRQLAVERQVRDGLQVAVDVDDDLALSGSVGAALYRIAHEALTNVSKHSGTREAILSLNLDGGLAYLEIEDHGLGFNPKAGLDERGHLGLAGMAERAREIGWHLSIDSKPGLGTRIRVQESPPGGGR